MPFLSFIQNPLRYIWSRDSFRPPLEEPIRAELFSIERLEQHAESLAAAQPITTKLRAGRDLLPRVQENGRVLLTSYRTIAAAVRERLVIEPAAEWLIDNFHIVDEQLREIRDDLPPSYYRKLPKLATGPFQGYPRVFGLAWAFVAHTDSRFEPEALRRFVRAYQRVQPLTIGELWAVAITLRIVLVENLRRLAERLVHGRAARQQADTLADALLGLGGRPVESVATVLTRFEGAPLETAFAVQLVQRLHDQDAASMPIRRWLDERLAAQDATAEDSIRAEHQRQAAMNVTVRNVITSMRLMSALDWTEFFESVSLVDEAFRASPGFAAMDFVTRDRYRHAIEELARGSQHSELEVTQQAVLESQHARVEVEGTETRASDLIGDRQTDPGYYLISRGRKAFEKMLGFRVSIKNLLLRAYLTEAMPGYLGFIVILSGILLALPFLHNGMIGGGTTGLLLFALLALIPASDVAVAVVNHAVTTLLGPRLFPRLELRDGIPSYLRTVIVAPTLLTDQAGIEEQIERLEVHYLANADGDLRFALLSDWTDAPKKLCQTTRRCWWRRSLASRV